MRIFRQILVIVFALLLFAVTQYISDVSAGALDWFFVNLPRSLSPEDYSVLHFLHQPFPKAALQGLPLVCLAFSILLFMQQKRKWAYLLIVLPLVPSIFILALFYNAAQIHVAPGESLLASGVLNGKKPSYALSRESENAD